jgi:nitroimidazol reductase NimA-like FMN-containing flavoprotein (pyridoxamine 5'-phosphate oxidase superfamily)
MRIVPASDQECQELLERVHLGRLACALDNQPYVVPVAFAHEPGQIYVFSTAGKKIEWMRQNPKVCLQVDEIGSRSNWTSVVINGTYLELREPQYTTEKERARSLLGDSAQWWVVAIAERREQVRDVSIETVFFRINIESISGLRGIPEP